MLMDLQIQSHAAAFGNKRTGVPTDAKLSTYHQIDSLVKRHRNLHFWPDLRILARRDGASLS